MADKTTGGAIIARMLKQEGVEKFFGIIDGTYTQLLKNCVDMGMQMITPRHESIAAHMAGAYATADRKTRRLSGLERPRGGQCPQWSMC